MKTYKNYGFTFMELLAVVAMVSFFIAFFLPALTSVSEMAVDSKCKVNLDQIGKSMKIYTIDLGRSTGYPPASGQGFLVHLYNTDILTENSIYLCPSTPDKNLAMDLGKLPDSGDGFGPVSFSGRRNRNQNLYPGIFTQGKNTAITTLAADDWNDGKIENHENGDMVIFLFLDGHSDYIKSQNASFDNYSFNYNPLAN